MPDPAKVYQLLMLLLFFLSKMNSTVPPSKHLLLELSVSNGDLSAWKRDVYFLSESASGQDDVVQYSSAVYIYKCITNA